MKRSNVIPQLAALALLCTGTVASADYPSPRENYLNDFANRLGDSTEQHIRDALSVLERDTGVEMSVAVIGSIAEYGTGDTTIETFATGLFNAWGVGNREKNDGILLLVALNDRAMRIEFGSGYQRAADAVAQDIIDREILPNFRNEHYARGIRAGTDALVAKVRAGALPLHSGLGAVMNKALGAVEGVGGWPAVGAGGVVLMFLYSGWKYFSRRRPRLCPQCRVTMRLLDELAEDRHLNAGEKLEENLQSVDYDIWQCPRCKITTKVQNTAWFSSYKQCPKCRMRTLKETSQVLQSATYSSAGSKRISGDCRSCSHHCERTESIPMKQSSSSGSSGRSSSSFGGGRSGGGGASGRW